MTQIAEHRHESGAHAEDRDVIGREFGNWLRGQIRERGLTSKAVAERAGISENHMSRIVRSGSGTRPKTIRGLAEAMGLPPEEVAAHAGIVLRTDPEPHSTIGERIRMRLSYLRMSQREFAELISEDYGCVRAWMSGADPQAWRLPKIAKALRVSHDFLLGTDTEVVDGREIWVDPQVVASRATGGPGEDVKRALLDPAFLRELAGQLASFFRQSRIAI